MSLTLDHVERLANLVKTLGLTHLEFDGLVIERDPRSDAAAEQAKAISQLQQNLNKDVSDMDILENPYAGLEGLNNV